MYYVRIHNQTTEEIVEFLSATYSKAVRRLGEIIRDFCFENHDLKIEFRPATEEEIAEF